MTGARVSNDEAARLAAVRRYRAALDGLVARSLDALVCLAARVCPAPMAALSFLDEDREVFQASTGVKLGDTPRDGSLGAQALVSDGLFVVPDASRDDRFMDSPLVTGEPGIRFYAGVPVVGPGGHRLGVLAVFDPSPRDLSTDQAKALATLGDEVGARLELACLLSGSRAEHALARAEARERAILEVNNAIISSLTQDALLEAISKALFRVVPFDRAALTLYEPETDTLRILALAGRLPPKSYPVGAALDRNDSHVGWAFEHQRTLLRGDLGAEMEFGAERRLHDEGIRSLVTAPLVLAGKSLGTITLGSTTPGQFAPADEVFLGDVAAQVAMAVSNMRAFEEIAALKARLQAENQYLQEEIRGEYNHSEIVGSSAALRELMRQVDQVATTDSTVLISGETGSGKELVARAIHERSRRRARPLVKVNCGAISAGLVESELFGHVKGAFTGALGARDGRFMLADGGTILLDEVGELPLEAQVKLLRVLQEQEFEPVGSSKSLKVDVRVIAATNRDLPAAVSSGTFRGDLFYRLNVVPITVPPLRVRPEDVELLVKFFVQKFAAKLSRPVRQVPEETLQRLRAYAWPGNIRELQNVIERAVVLAQGSVLSLAPEFGLPVSVAAPQPPRVGPAIEAARRNETLKELERRHIESVLLEKNWMIEGERGAAKILNIHPNTLRSRMRKLGLRRPN